MTIAFDERTLTGYFASRSYALRIFLIATFTAKVKAVADRVATAVASAVRVPAFAPIAA